MKKGMDRYASNQKLQQKGYFQKYRRRSAVRPTCKAGSCDSILDSEKSQEEERINHEDIREENVVEAHQEGQQGVSLSVERGHPAEEEDLKIKVGEKKVKKKTKHEKHEAKETKAQERKEDKKEKKSKK
jgi:hypothetical protein